MTSEYKGRVDVIVNPMARGVASPQRIKTACDALLARSWDVRPWYTRRPGDARALAATAVAARASFVIACGGDGTLNETLQPLAGSETALSVIPGGTANVWAREAGFPKDPTRAALAIETAEIVRSDLGRAGDRYFLLMASIGFDALVAQTISPALKKRLGTMAYAIQAAAELKQLKSAPIRLAIDGRVTELQAIMVVLGNTRLYGGVLEITRLAEVNDGLLDLCALDADGVLQSLKIILDVRRGRHVTAAQGVLYQQLKDVVFMTPGLPVQVDGDAAGQTPMHFRVVPGAARLVMPNAPQSHLVRRSAV